MLCHLCILGDSPQRGAKLEVAASPLPSAGPKRGQKCYITRAFSGSPTKGDQNQKSQPYPCLVMGPKEGVNGTSPPHSGGSCKRETK